MNQERVRERKGQFNGHDHNHDGQRAHQRRLDASSDQLREHVELIEGNLPDLFEQPRIECYDTRAFDGQLPRNDTIYEIGKRSMRRITRSGRR
jgi:hypothetical protein